MPDSAPRTVLIAGCGDLGTEAGLRFLDSGHRVVGVRRRADLLPAEFDRQRVDLTVDAPILPEGTDVVVVPLTPSARTAEEYRRTYVDGLRNVLRGVEAVGARPRLVFVSSTAVHAGGGGERIDERTPPEASTETSAVLLEAERVAAASGLECCLLRLGGVYGPGRERLVDQVRSGRARLPAAPSFTNRIHRDDAAGAIVHLALQDAAPPPAVIGVDDEPADLADVLRFIADELGLPVPPTDDGPADGADGRRLSNALLRSTGFDLAFPTFREGYRAVLEGRGRRHP